MNNKLLTNWNQLYDKGAWFGDTYLEKLSDVTEKEAFTPPLKDVHSIAELVAHVIYWRTPIIKRLTGVKDYLPSMESPENWQSVEALKSKGWKTLLSELDDSQKQLTSLLAKTKPEFFKEEYSQGNSWEYVTEGILQHDIYHLGQIALVKKIIRM